MRVLQTRLIENDFTVHDFVTPFCCDDGFNTTMASLLWIIPNNREISFGNNGFCPGKGFARNMQCRFQLVFRDGFDFTGIACRYGIVRKYCGGIENRVAKNPLRQKTRQGFYVVGAREGRFRIDQDRFERFLDGLLGVVA